MRKTLVAVIARGHQAKGTGIFALGNHQTPYSSSAATPSVLNVSHDSVVKENSGERCVFKIAQCILCSRNFISGRASPSEIQLKPPGAGIRVLAIDGGGI